MTNKIGRLTRAAAAVCVLLAVGGCDKLLEVDLPDAVTSDALDDPSTAALLVNSVMASVECGYSSMAIDAAGMEDNFQMVTGVAGNYSQYGDTPGGGPCDGDAYSQEWIDPLLIARGQGYATYESISGWDVADKQELLAKVSLYNAITLDVFGEYFCEFAIDGGPLLTASQTLDIAEGWVDSTLARTAAAGGDFAITTQQGTITTSIMGTAYGLRSRIRWANGDMAGAVADAQNVPDGFMSWILREDGEDRRNMVSSMQGGGGGVQAAGFLQGPVKLKTPENSYGISLLGSFNGVPWPDPVPFTGYLDLAITAEGRAVDDDGYPITTETAGAVFDTRIEYTIGNTAGGPDNIIQKYKSLSDDIPLINWKEMRLIQAEAAGPSAAGVDLVNDLRALAGLPLVSGAYRALVEGDADKYEDLIIEERRRELWLEARFWSTKILNTDKLWFPRRVGDWVNPGASYVLAGGVRLLLQNDEYQINPNMTLASRGTGCSPDQAPVFN